MSYAVWLVTAAGRGVAPSVAVFQCIFSLGTSVREGNAMLHVMSERLQDRKCVCARVCVGWRWGRAVNTSKVTSFS